MRLSKMDAFPAVHDLQCDPFCTRHVVTEHPTGEKDERLVRLVKMAADKALTQNTAHVYAGVYPQFYESMTSDIGRTIVAE